MCADPLLHFRSNCQLGAEYANLLDQGDERREQRQRLQLGLLLHANSRLLCKEKISFDFRSRTCPELNLSLCDCLEQVFSIGVASYAAYRLNKGLQETLKIRERFLWNCVRYVTAVRNSLD